MAARRRFGQHFLADERAAARLVAAARIERGEPVLEIGPGRGALTGRLVEAAGRLVAIEIDPRLGARLAARYAPERLLLVVEDVLELSFAEVLARLGRSGERLVVVSNLPYEISQPVADKLIRERSTIARAVLTFQREVAVRLVAGPGSRNYAPASVLGGLTYRVERLFDIAPGAFRPPPAVTSTVTRWMPRDDAIDAEDERRLRHALAICFAQRRRTLRNNVRHALGDEEAAASLLARAGLDPGLRAEQVPPEAFLRLARLF